MTLGQDFNTDAFERSVLSVLRAAHRRMDRLGYRVTTDHKEVAQQRGPVMVISRISPPRPATLISFTRKSSTCRVEFADGQRATVQSDRVVAQA